MRTVDINGSAFRILHEDDCCIAVLKPAGMFVHPTSWSTETDVLTRRLQDFFGHRVFPVHRLDRATSGVIVFGRSSEAAGGLARQFRERRVVKKYLAVVRGYTDHAGTIDHPLRADDNKPARDAVTDFRRISTVELPVPAGRYPTARFSLIEAMPKTGRLHQIRRHLHHISHPVVGDTVYGKGLQNRLFRELFSCHRLLLTAVELTFEHPVTDQLLTITAPLDDELRAIFTELGWASRT